MSKKNRLIPLALALMSGPTGGVADASAVTSWKLMDFDNDGLSSDFRFFTTAPGNSPNQFAAGGGDGVPIIMDSGPIGPHVFTAGFAFPSTPPTPAAPFIFGNIAAAITGASLDFSALDFGLVVEDAYLHMAPDVLDNCTAGPFVGSGCGTLGFGYHTEVSDLGSGNFGVVVRYAGTVNDATIWNGFQGNWRLEGIMTTVPIPSALWLSASGLIALAAVAKRKRPALERKGSTVSKRSG